MPDLGEYCQRRRANPQVRTVWPSQIGKALFDLREARPQRIVSTISDRGRVELIIQAGLQLEPR